MAGSPVKGRSIVVGVCGSIAAFKAADVVSELTQRGAIVTPIMTAGARKFITALTLQTLSGRRVLTKNFDPDLISDPTHIQLAKSTELVLIAPATANVIGKMAGGIADDLLTTFVLAVRCPILLAPAMNTQMWTHPAVQSNVAALRSRGVKIVEPGEGRLACGDTGAGRLSEPDELVRAVEVEMARRR